MFREVEKLIDKLINKECTFLYRASDMLCLRIGDTILIDSRKTKGEKEESPEYRIHFQCQWRFVKGGKILLASHDIYNPYNNELEYDDNWDWDKWGREKEQSSVFDVKQEDFTNIFLPLKIKNIYFTDTHDLHIEFDKGIIFDTFITQSTKREYYRFLDFHTDNHIVVFDVD